MSACGGLPRTPQPAEGVNYAHKIEKAESQIDWRQDAEAIARRLRAFNPFPGGATQYGDESIKVWEAHADPAIAVGTAAPGTVLSAGADGVRVACGNGVLCMTLLQRAGGKRLAAGDFLRGFDLPEGDRKSTRLNSSHSQISYAVFCLKKKKHIHTATAEQEAFYLH